VTTTVNTQWNDAVKAAREAGGESVQQNLVRRQQQREQRNAKQFDGSAKGEENHKYYKTKRYTNYQQRKQSNYNDKRDM
jgi:hypothetical protein